MGTTNTQSTGSHVNESELQKFTLHFEATPRNENSSKRSVKASR